MSTEIPKQACPYCGYVMDRSASMVGEGSPTEGDISLCMKCGGLLLFGSGMAFRTPTMDELTKIKRSPEWQAIKYVRAKIEEVWDK